MAWALKPHARCEQCRGRTRQLTCLCAQPAASSQSHRFESSHPSLCCTCCVLLPVPMRRRTRLLLCCARQCDRCATATVRREATAGAKQRRRSHRPRKHSRGRERRSSFWPCATPSGAVVDAAGTGSTCTAALAHDVTCAYMLTTRSAVRSPGVPTGHHWVHIGNRRVRCRPCDICCIGLRDACIAHCSARPHGDSQVTPGLPRNVLHCKSDWLVCQRAVFKLSDHACMLAARHCRTASQRDKGNSRHREPDADRSGDGSSSGAWRAAGGGACAADLCSHRAACGVGGSVGSWRQRKCCQHRGSGSGRRSMCGLLSNQP